MQGTISRKHTINRPDGRQIVIQSPSTEGWATYFTGAGDDKSPTFPNTGRGEGKSLNINFTGIEEKHVDIEFIEPVELHDGQIFYKPTNNWTNEDRFSVYSILPASQVIENTQCLGNCNLHSIKGMYNLIVPSLGNGNWDIDLNKAIPVPAENNGYWDVDYKTGEITPSLTPGEASFNLLDCEVKSSFLKNMPMGNPLGVFDIDTYKAEWIHQNWKIRLTVDKKSNSEGAVGGWLMLFRVYTT